MNLFKKFLVLVGVLAVALTSSLTEVKALEVSYDFDLIAEVFDYGEAIHQVVIKTGENTKVDKNSLSKDTFKVVSNAVSSVDIGENPAYGLYENIERNVTSVELDDKGNIVINLETKYNGKGQGTLNYVAGEVSRNLSMDITYTVEQKAAYKTVEGADVAVATRYVQKAIVNAEVEKFESAQSNGIDYRYFTPENAKDGKKHPLIIWFHGNGEGGYKEARNNTSQLTGNRGALGFTEKEAQDIFGGAYVVAPQAPDTWYNNYSKDYIGKATAMIKEFADNNAVDKDRIYVYGASAGGYMTIRMAIENPDLFAAVVATCPAIGVAPERGGVETKDEEIKKLSAQNLWVIQSKDDTTVVEESVARISKLAPETIYVTYDEVTLDGNKYPGHWAWIYTAHNMPEHEGTKVFDWTSKQAKESKKDSNLATFAWVGAAVVGVAVVMIVVSKKKKDSNKA